MRAQKFIPVFVLIIILFFITPASAAEIIGIHFPPGERAHEPILDLYRNAEKSIHLAIYSLTKNDIARALIKAHKRGIEVKVIMDDEKAEGEYSDADKLERAGIEVVRDTPFALMHNKFCIIDNIIVYTGSYNHTKSGTVANDENIIVIKDREVARIYEEQFQKLWKKYQ